MVYKNMNKLEREVSSLSFGEFDKLSQEDMDWVESNSMKYFPLERRNYSENGRFRGVLAAYFVFYQRIGDWQCIRFIMARERYNQPISYFEPIRYWLNREGEYVLEMKRRNGMLYCDSWAEDSELEIRRTQNVQLLYLAWTDKFFKVKPELFIRTKKENVSLHICKESIIFEVSNNQNNTTFSWAKLIIIIRISKCKQNFFHL